MNNIGLKSFTFNIGHDFNATAAVYTGVVFSAPSNGLTIISNLVRDTIIRKVSVSALAPSNRTGTSVNTAGLQVNFFQMEYDIVDFAGQQVKSGGGFGNLFVPSPNIFISGTDNISGFVNQIQPTMEHCVRGAGIYIKRLAFAVNGMTGTPVTSFLSFDVTVTYTDN